MSFRKTFENSETDALPAPSAKKQCFGLSVVREGEGITSAAASAGNQSLISRAAGARGLGSGIGAIEDDTAYDSESSVYSDDYIISVDSEEYSQAVSELTDPKGGKAVASIALEESKGKKPQKKAKDASSSGFKGNTLRGRAQTTDKLRKVTARHEVVANKRLNNPGVVPPGYQEMQAYRNAPVGSPINRFHERAAQLWDKLWETYEEALEAYKVDTSAWTEEAKKAQTKAEKADPSKAYNFATVQKIEHCWAPQVLSAVMRSGLNKDQMLAEILRGFNPAIQTALGIEDWSGLLEEFKKSSYSVQTAHWRGVYFAIAGVDNPVLYCGSTGVTVQERTRSHTSEIKRCVRALEEGKDFPLKTQQIHHIMAKRIVSGKDISILDLPEIFHVAALYPDNHIWVSIQLAEAFLIAYLGTMFAVGKLMAETQKDAPELIRKVRKHLPRLQGHCVNFSFPIAEGNHLLLQTSSAEPRCSNCGDTRSLRVEHGIPFQRYKSGLCIRCYNYQAQHNRAPRPMHLWYSYLRTELPKCRVCKNVDPEVLTISNDSTASFQGIFSCFTCCSYHRSNSEDTPEPLWLPHLRRKLRCNSCGYIEGSTDLEFKIIVSSSTVICEQCWQGTGRNERLKMCKISPDNQGVQLLPLDERAADPPLITAAPWEYDNKVIPLKKRKGYSKSGSKLS